MSDKVCSEVHSFTKETSADADCEEGCLLASFVFTPPPNLSFTSSPSTNVSDTPSGESELTYDSDGDVEVARRENPPSEESELTYDSDGDVEVTRRENPPSEESELTYDSDGDVEVTRRENPPSDLVLLVEYRLSTCLADVGLQVWRGSLLLADYLLHHHRQFNVRQVLEVGAGTALASIVAASCGSRVLATDLDQSGILQLMKRNINRNRNFIKGVISVEPMDLFGQANDVVAEFLSDTQIVISGDIIYDTKVTEAFVGFIKTAMSNFKVDKRNFIVALEKRFVFTIDDLDTVAPAYDYFMDLLNELLAQPPEGYSMSVDHVSTNFPQYFCYERGNSDLKVREEFKHHKSIPIDDSAKIKSMYLYGERMLKELTQNVDFASA